MRSAYRPVFSATYPCAPNLQYQGERQKCMDGMSAKFHEMGSEVYVDGSEDREAA
jgi:uncharacterized membrane protein